MKRQSKNVKRVVGVLEGAIPQLVSLVAHAGNQQSFTHVRSDDGGEVRVRERSRGTPPKAVHVRSITFDKAQFGTVEEVSAFMDGHGFADFAVAKRGDNFVVEATTDDLVDTAEVKLAEGVTALVGKPAPVTPGSTAARAEGDGGAKSPAAQTRSEVDEVPAPKAELIQRYSDWSAYDYAGWFNRDAKTIKEVMKGGADGLPPGYEEVLYAFNAALKNALADRDTAAVDALVLEFGTFIKTLAATFDEGTVPDPLLYQRSEGDPTVSTANPTPPATTPAPVAPETAPAVTETPPATTETPATTDTTTAAVAEGAAADPAETARTEAPALDAGTTAILAELGKISTRIDALETKAAETVARGDGKAPVEAAPDRKGLVNDSGSAAQRSTPAAEPDEDTKKDLACMQRMQRSAFGLG